MAFDIRTYKWSERILNTCGISKELLPEAVPSGVVIGKVSDFAANSSGLKKGTKIVSGGHDQVCCALGAGVLSDGIAMDSLGTTESILCVNKELNITKDMRQNNLACYCYPVDDLYAYLTFLSSSGAILKWFRDLFPESCRFDYHEMNIAVKSECPGYTGLLILPHFAGSGTPYLDFDSKGMIYGLTLGTTKYQIYKSIIESTCLESKINIECMEQSGIKVDELYCVGGGAGSELWLQLKADITGKTVASPPVSEMGCFGAAILAGLGTGVYNKPADAFGTVFDNITKYYPNRIAGEEYNIVYEDYKKLYGLSTELRGGSFGISRI